jgi:hypothetical protein
MIERIAYAVLLTLRVRSFARSVAAVALTRSVRSTREE